MNYKLLNRILYGVWAVSPQHVNGYLPLLTSVLKNEKLPDANWAEGRELKKPKNQTYLYNPKLQRWYEYDSYTLKGEGMRLRVFSLTDVITKYDQVSGQVGTTTMANYLKMAEQDEEIDAILLEIDSPGGEASYTPDLVEIIQGLSKPIIADVSGLAASAGYWIAAACDEIWASQPTDVIGSIGTMITIMDLKTFYEKQGLPIHEIYATASVDKNKDFKEALEGNYKPIKEGLLDPFNTAFTGSIKKMREGKLDLAKEDVLTGKTYTAEEALQFGLIDGIGNRDTVLSRLNTLIQQNKSDSNMNLINKVLGIKEESTEVSTEQEQFLAELKELKQANNAKEIELAELKAKLEATQENLAVTKDLLAEEKKNTAFLEAKLERAEAEKATPYTSENDSNGITPYINAEAEHNKEADKVLSKRN